MGTAKRLILVVVAYTLFVVFALAPVTALVGVAWTFVADGIADVFLAVPAVMVGTTAGWFLARYFRGGDGFGLDTRVVYWGAVVIPLLVVLSGLAFNASYLTSQVLADVDMIVAPAALAIGWKIGSRAQTETAAAATDSFPSERPRHP